MAGNTFGRIFRLTTFGESHGAALGGVIDGCPAGLPICEEEIQAELDLRKPGTGAAGTKRREDDRIHLLSGIFEGKTTGTPIGFYIANSDHRSADYGNLAEVFRPGHADWSYFHKYNGIRDYRGGGRASGRETVCRVAGGAVAKKLLYRSCGIYIQAGCVELGGIEVAESDIDLAQASNRAYFAAADNVIPLWDEKVAEARSLGDTLGGIVRIIAYNVPPGLGEPVFDKLDASLAYALMSVGAVKGVEIGSGFMGARLKGSANNDPLLPCGENYENGLPRAEFASNMAGGILGGISSGQPVILQVAVKPIASISQIQNTVDKSGKAASIRIGGRHDLSAIPRIVPVLSAMTAMCLADALLLQARMGIIFNV